MIYSIQIEFKNIFYCMQNAKNSKLTKEEYLRIKGEIK